MVTLITLLYALAITVIAQEATSGITLREYGKNCGQDLIDTIDNLMYTALVKLTTNIMDMKKYIVRFHLQRTGHGEYTQMCQVDLENECKENKQELCYCRDNYEIVWNTTAYHEDSKALIKATLLIKGNGETDSNILTAPQIVKATPGITIREYGKNCGQDLIDTSDNLMYTALVKLTTNIMDMKKYIVRFHLQRTGHDEYTQMCQVDLENECKENKQELCYCRDNYEIVWNTTAYHEDSKALIKATLLIKGNGETDSNILTAPQIVKALSIENLQLLVNEAPVKNNNTITISNDTNKISIRLPDDIERTYGNCGLHFDIENHRGNAVIISMKPHKITTTIMKCDRKLGRFTLKIKYDQHNQATPDTLEISTKTPSDKTDNVGLQFYTAILVVTCVILTLQLLYFLHLSFPYIKATIKEMKLKPKKAHKRQDKDKNDLTKEGLNTNLV
ncbi:polymorphic transmembrane cluster 2 transmembrane protein 9 [Biomphalaria pfeifferi]|uniref:Polymorphic transmembrane cluster 2 transmembrane protein 9 n=1 Tax=Biomphalaria pfeifferi TaxID=112525 RepID=A0AAD8C6J8_BIOPF|nr:polymorphic transmembrane cluster 2 transmembrane protein 9 [Biomphalaria pfeifferi]